MSTFDEQGATGMDILSDCWHNEMVELSVELKQL
jgi:hypothetical protein